jgi:hypothetical protein
MAADKKKLTAETVAELAPILKEIVDEGRSPTEAFTEHGYSMRVVKAVYASFGRVGAVAEATPTVVAAGMTDTEIDAEVRTVLSIPEAVIEPEVP